ncbi:MAG: polyprenyl synthetase family protein [Gammaproteobacteria bacterium]|nr:polyprenyl synthetase family protein [Gammaproteobacteria bacterium]
MLLRSATDLARDELEQVNAVIRRHLESDIALIRTLGAYIVQSGGKRLRPLILLLSAKAGAANHRDNKNRNNETHNDSIILAAVIEFIHTATLLHDDVVDASKMRRGRATANHVWGNEASVLVGDFLYSRAFEMMLETNNMEVMRILAATTNAIAEGEVLQLMNARAPDTTERAYFDTIHRKTAKLFESAARLGMVAAGRPPAECAALATFGLRFGAAFQLVDDILDYRADSADIGKNAGDDLAEGKLTLPLIIALQRGGEKQRRVLRRAVEDGAREALAEVLGIVESTGALAYTTQLAKREAAAAVDALSGIRASPYKDALARLAEFAVRRGH